MNKLIADVIARVATEHGYSPADILGRDRHAHVVKARHSAMLEARRLGFSYPELGRAFKRDHTTVMHAIEKRYRAMAAEVA